jgi:IQ motif/SEC7 domain-containing protein
MPDLGIDYLVKQGFLELSPLSVAKFLHATPDLARAKLGEYISEAHNAFSMKVLSCYLEKFDFAGLRVDKALRKFLQTVQIPGEAQKIEKIMEMFGKRFLKCNPNFANKLKSTDSIATLCVAIMLLSTDIHTPDIKPDKKLIEKDFLSQLHGADAGRHFDQKLLKSIFKSVKKQEFQTTPDHVAQTQLLRSRVSGKAPHLSDSHRRLVCLCRLAEVTDINSKKEGDANSHHRDIWLFNDMLLVTKASGKNNQGLVYSYRDSFYLTGLEVTLFHTPVFKYGIQISRKVDNAVLSTLNAASEQDRYKFVMDLQESIFEMDMMGRALQAANIAK